MSSPVGKKELFGGLLAAASLLALGWNSFSLPSHPNKAVHAEIGRMLGAETLRLLKPGGKVTIIARDTEAFAQPAMDEAVKVLQCELKQAGREVRSVEHIQLDPIRPSELPSGDFYELLRRLPATDVIVSLLGPPMLLPEHFQRLGSANHASVVALCTETVDIEALLKSGLLHSALLNKPAAASGTSFDQLYAVIRSTGP